VKSNFPGTKLLIVGSGEAQPQIEQLREHLGLGSDSRFEPAQSNVAPWMRSIDVFVMCSQSESFPNALLEAMACGCCVIGSNVGGIPELIQPDQSGLLFQCGDIGDLAEKLSSVLKDALLRKRLGAAAANRATNEFSMQKAVTRIERIYTSLLTA
jgi:glycosyltransferase involved in cell wall biosynthesis